MPKGATVKKPKAKTLYISDPKKLQHVGKLLDRAIDAASQEGLSSLDDFATFLEEHTSEISKNPIGMRIFTQDDRPTGFHFYLLSEPDRVVAGKYLATELNVENRYTPTALMGALGIEEEEEDEFVSDVEGEDEFTSDIEDAVEEETEVKPPAKTKAKSATKGSIQERMQKAKATNAVEDDGLAIDDTPPAKTASKAKTKSKSQTKPVDDLGLDDGLNIEDSPVEPKAKEKSKAKSTTKVADALLDDLDLDDSKFIREPASQNGKAKAKQAKAEPASEKGTKAKAKAKQTPEVEPAKAEPAKAKSQSTKATTDQASEKKGKKNTQEKGRSKIDDQVSASMRAAESATTAGSDLNGLNLLGAIHELAELATNTTATVVDEVDRRVKEAKIAGVTKQMSAVQVRLVQMHKRQQAIEEHDRDKVEAVTEQAAALSDRAAELSDRMDAVVEADQQPTQPPVATQNAVEVEAESVLTESIPESPELTSTTKPPAKPKQEATASSPPFQLNNVLSTLASSVNRLGVRVGDDEKLPKFKVDKDANIYQRLDALESYLKAMNRRLDALEARIAAMEQERGIAPPAKAEQAAEAEQALATAMTAEAGVHTAETEVANERTAVADPIELVEEPVAEAPIAEAIAEVATEEATVGAITDDIDMETAGASSDAATVVDINVKNEYHYWKQSFDQYDEDGHVSDWHKEELKAVIESLGFETNTYLDSDGKMHFSYTGVLTPEKAQILIDTYKQIGSDINDELVAQTEAEPDLEDVYHHACKSVFNQFQFCTQAEPNNQVFSFESPYHPGFLFEFHTSMSEPGRPGLRVFELTEEYPQGNSIFSIDTAEKFPVTVYEHLDSDKVAVLKEAAEVVESQIRHHPFAKSRQTETTIQSEESSIPAPIALIQRLEQLDPKAFEQEGGFIETTLTDPTGHSSGYEFETIELRGNLMVYGFDRITRESVLTAERDTETQSWSVEFCSIDEDTIECSLSNIEIMDCSVDEEIEDEEEDDLEL
jgi:hypothetical protein